jgi:hypothetical protein
MQKLRLPDAYIPDTYIQAAGLHGSGVGGTGTWPIANKALYVPVIFPVPATLTSIAMIAFNGTGNYDLGFCDGYTKKRIASSGSTAMTAAGMKKLTFATPIRVDAGRLYYGALALSSASGNVWRSNYSIAACIAAGMGEQVTALPLPDPIVPATVLAAYMPIFVFGIQ